MKAIIFLLLSVLSVYSQPTIHLGQDIAFEGDYRVGEAITYPDGHYGSVVFWSTTLRINPVENNGLLNWFIWDEWNGPLKVDGSVPITTSEAIWYPAEYFCSPLPVGYYSPPQQWTTNYFAIAYVPFNRDNYEYVFDTGITSYQSGHVWLDWTRQGKLRVTWSNKPPKYFGIYPHRKRLAQVELAKSQTGGGLAKP